MSIIQRLAAFILFVFVGEIFTTLQEAKVLMEVWRREYNQVRLHSSLGYRPPAPETVEGAVSATAS